MRRVPPKNTGKQIDLYVRTYYSLLRSSGEVWVRAFEEAHSYSNSSLHAGARDSAIDVAAFAYSAARLPDCITSVRRVVLGQSHQQFEGAGFAVRGFQRVRSRGRRRAMAFDGDHTLAAFVTSTSDIDDLVPILTAFQIEWNKMHARLGGKPPTLANFPEELGISAADGQTLLSALGENPESDLVQIATRPLDLSLRLLSGSYAEYQRASHRWWSGIEPVYVRSERPHRPPVYIVSSNTHSLVNLLGGYARMHQPEILRFARERNPEGLASELERAIAEKNDGKISNIAYYLLRRFLHAADGDTAARLAEVQRFDAEGGIHSIESPGRIDVGAQCLDMHKLVPSRFDPRVAVPGIERLAKSDAVILNIDYPLGMAAYHHLARIAQGVGEIRGIYVMGKAATLNGRVGDVAISSVVHEVHSENTYLFRNAFDASHVQPWLEQATVLDNQKALTVRGTFLQNTETMGSYYKDGYTVLEMEAGPYLSAIYELVYPVRHPEDEIIHLSNATPFDVGILHYASDTPYSRRQSLLSKSLSYFGVESTYACAIAIVRRIFEREVARLA